MERGRDGEKNIRRRSVNDTKSVIVGAIRISGGFMALPEFVHQVHCVVRPLGDETLTRIS